MLTFRKLICLAVFLIVAYALQLTFAGERYTPVVYGLALFAAACWLARELTHLYLDTPRPPFQAPQREITNADYQRWYNEPQARQERYAYRLTLLGVGVAVLLVVVAMGFVAWQAARPLVPQGVAPLVVLAIAAAMVFYTGGLRLLRPEQRA